MLEEGLLCNFKINKEYISVDVNFSKFIFLKFMLFFNGAIVIKKL